MLELFEEVIEYATGRLPISVIVSLVQMHGIETRLATNYPQHL
jgi:hypothetical protein